MTQDNSTSLVGSGKFKFTQQLYTGADNIGDGVPLIEASYIAAPKSIKYNSFSKTYTWNPLSSYLFDIKERLDAIQASITTLTEVLTNA